MQMLNVVCIERPCMKPCILSLCSGIGGIDLAAEWAGFEIAGQVEIDEYCRQVLAKHWPDVPRRNDIHEIQGNEFGHIDLIAGGIPCQPFSAAGKRQGKEDHRHLWPAMLRIVERARPSWVLIENVANFVGMALDDVLADLESQGYEAGTFVFPAMAVGAPHRRDRVFIVANTASIGAREQDSQAFADAYQRDTWMGSGSCNGRQPITAANTPMADTQRNRSQAIRQEQGVLRSQGFEVPIRSTYSSGIDLSRSVSGWQIWAVEPDVGRVAHGIPCGVDRLRSLGNAVVPQQIYPILASIAAIHEAMTT